MSDYLVDISMLVYNHEKYIAQAIEGVVQQKTNFKFRVLIGEDCSKDNSRSIIADYAERYPDIVFPFFHEKNIGAVPNGTFIAAKLTSKYIAICEGDDYWTDPNKLQKQVDFLEANPDFSFCFTDVAVRDEMLPGKELLPSIGTFPAVDKEVVSFEDFLFAPQNIVPTPTVLFRNLLPKPLPAFYFEALSSDIFVQLFMADKGKARYFREQTAVYRNHGGGISKSEGSKEAGERLLIKLYHNLNKYFDYRYDALFKKKFLDMAKVQLLYGAKGKKGMDKMKHYFTRMADYLKYSEKINLKELAYYHLILFFPSLLKAMKKSKAV